MLLEVKNLRKEYIRDGTPFAAVDDVHFSVDEHDFVFITGRSGSGKSTLLSIIAGLMKPDTGTVVFDGRELTSMKDSALSRLRNDGLGYIPQGASLLANLSVIENVLLPFWLYKRDTNGIKEKAEKLLEDVGIARLADSYPPNLSGGEIKRAAIARALINSPKLIIADEPTSDLDTQSAEDVMKLFSSFSDKAAVLLVTHDNSLLNMKQSRHLQTENGVITELL